MLGCGSSLIYARLKAIKAGHKSLEFLLRLGLEQMLTALTVDRIILVISQTTVLSQIFIAAVAMSNSS